MIENNSVKSLKYRYDVDALRALAVISVVFFHYQPNILPNGFLGVDVFFVISGYLLTGIIWDEMRAGSFSSVSFYIRRIKRILPALFVLMSVVSAVALVLLLPADLTGFAKSILASLFFVPNVYFWRDTNYFSRAADEKPLLNLWSLGVEEQFYFILPLVLIVSWKYFSRSSVFLILFASIFSFFLNIVLIRHGGASPAFYLLPTRFWELGFGAVLGMLNSKMTSPKWFSEVGFALILLSLAVPTSAIYGVPIATVSVIGASMVVLSGGNTAALSSIVSLKPINFFGRISYSLYLWHWPLIVFWSYRYVREPSAFESLLLFCAAVVAAWLSWKWIEEPSRRGGIKFRDLVYGLLAGALLLIVFALAVISTSGFPSRLTEEAGLINSAVGTHYRCEVSRMSPFGASRACDLTLGGKGVSSAELVLLGNSHAQMYAPLIEELASLQGESAVLIPVNSCLPTITLNISLACIDAAEKNIEEILRLKSVKKIIIAHNWPATDLISFDGTSIKMPNDKMVAAATINLASRLSVKGAEVYLVGPLSVPGYDIASEVSRKIAFGFESDFQSDFVTSAAVWEGRFSDAVKTLEESGFPVLRPDKVQCSSGICTFIDEEGSLFADSNHLSRDALYRFRDVFESVFLDE